MTEYKKEDVDSLLADLEKLKNGTERSYHGYQKICALLDSFKPKPDKVAVLRDWIYRTESEIFFCTEFRVSEDAWNQLRNITAREPAAEPAPKRYKMPEWDVVCQRGKHEIMNHQIPIIIDGMRWGIGEEVYRSLAAFISRLPNGDKS